MAKKAAKVTKLLKPDPKYLRYDALMRLTILLLPLNLLWDKMVRVTSDMSQVVMCGSELKKCLLVSSESVSLTLLI